MYIKIVRNKWLESPNLEEGGFYSAYNTQVIEVDEYEIRDQDSDRACLMIDGEDDDIERGIPMYWLLDESIRECTNVYVMNESGATIDRHVFIREPMDADFDFRSGNLEQVEPEGDDVGRAGHDGSFDGISGSSTLTGTRSTKS